MPEFIYSMHNVRKKLGDKVVLDNVTLSFYPSAKIGVVGPNGTGKSTLLKLMAGIEKPNNGDAMLAKDATVGILLQEPPLTEGKTVLENVEEGVADIKALQVRMDELGAAMGEPDADFDVLMAEMRGSTELDARNAWDIDSQLEQAMTPRAHRQTPWSISLGRRTPSRRTVQLCCSSRPAVARRTDQPSECRVGAVARDPPTLPRGGLGGDPTDTWTTWRSGSSNSTAAEPIRTRATTRPISTPRRVGSRSKVVEMPSAPRSSSVSWSGRGPIRRRDRPRTERG